jgi:hypothetical protein
MKAVIQLQRQRTHVETGVFAADMQVKLLKDGRVTFVPADNDKQDREALCGVAKMYWSASQFRPFAQVS